MTIKQCRFIAHLLFLVPALYGTRVLAFQPIVFENGAELDVSTELNYVNMKRLSDPDPLLTNPANSNAINMDDGNRTVNKHGSIDNRISMLVDVRLAKNNYSAFMRANSFYDSVYSGTNGNMSQATFNGGGPSDQFGPEVRPLAGSRTRLLDAYAMGRWKLCENDNGEIPLTVRVGRQVVAWGEGLLFMGIGGSMNPQDGLKGQIPGTPVKELFLPTEQVSATLGVTERLSLMSYWKWKFRETEVMPVGTYFNYTDMVGPGASFLREVGNLGAWRAPDIGRKPQGQWGIGGKYQLTNATNVGLYFLRYNELAGQPEFIFSSDYWILGKGPTPAASDPLAGFLASTSLAPSSFRIRYMNDIKLTGASFSTKIGDANIAGEIAMRDGAPVLMADPHYLQARARVINTQLSAIRVWGPEHWYVLPRPDSTEVHGEIATSHVSSFQTPDSTGIPTLPPSLKYDKNSLAYAFGISMKYFAVFPGWDLEVPIDWMHQLNGNPGMQGWNSGLQGENDRRLGIGLKFSYLQNLELGVKLAYYLGKADFSDHSFHTMVDRDYIGFTAAYHF